jgi:hypothetical protein
VTSEGKLGVREEEVYERGIEKFWRDRQRKKGSFWGEGRGMREG